VGYILGQEMTMLSHEQIERFILEEIPDAKITVGEFGCGGDHLTVEVVSPAFAGKTRVAQHQMVYAALRAHLDDGTIHALGLTTKEKD
jgi:stress-induced morphogen